VQQGSVRQALDTDADGQPDQQRDLLPDLPDGAESATIADGGDGWLYVGVGTHADHAATPGALEGSILRFRPDGTGVEVYATGLRMPFGLAFDSRRQLYATENGREGLGYDSPPDEINQIQPGADYGWPRCWGGRREDPDGGGGAELCAQTQAPVAELPAHAGAAGLVFYSAAAFPAEYHGDAFVALSGSWYGAEARGHSVVRMHGPAREILPFASGFGRPVGLAVGPEGQLLVVDYDRGIVYRIVAAS